MATYSSPSPNFTSSITAAGDNVQVGAYTIGALSFDNRIATCAAAANSVVLPASPVIGQPYTVRNDGKVYCSVFPPVGGTIGAFAINTQFFLGKGGMVKFICSRTTSTPTSTWYVLEASNNLPVIDIANRAGTALPITVNYEGSIIRFASQANALAVSMPTAVDAPGAKYTFMLGSAANVAAITITPAGGSFTGSLISAVVAPALANIPCIAKATLVITTAATAGTVVEVVSDGAIYLTKGVSTIAASFA